MVIAILSITAVAGGFESTKLLEASRNMLLKRIAWIEVATQIAALICMIGWASPRSLDLGAGRWRHLLSGVEDDTQPRLVAGGPQSLAVGHIGVSGDHPLRQMDVRFFDSRFFRE